MPTNLLPRTIGLVLLAAALGTAGWAQETLVVNKAFDGREVKLRVGAALRVELEQPGATGYEWQLKQLDTSVLELVRAETLTEPARDAVAGAPVKRAWVLKAKERGVTELHFLCYRGWEGEGSAADKFVLKVRIP